MSLYSMLTIFACPKSFADPHIALIQRNAITSWTLLRPKPEILLFGDESGTEEICRELGLRHVSEVARNKFGTPLVNDIFEKAERLAKDRLLCYVNADIILMDDFTRAVNAVAKKRDRFLMVGQRWNVDIDAPCDFNNHWQEAVRLHTRKGGRLEGYGAMDYFVFTRGTWPKLPPFALGRTVWDNWLLYAARSQGLPLIDATPSLIAVHQNHHYDHGQGKQEVWNGAEARNNLDLAGGERHGFNLHDANYILRGGRLQRALGNVHLARHLHTVPVLYPRMSAVVRGVKLLLKWTRPVRWRLRDACNR